MCGLLLLEHTFSEWVHERWQLNGHLVGASRTGRAGLEHVLAIASEQDPIQLPASKGRGQFCTGRGHGERLRSEGRDLDWRPNHVDEFNAIRKMEFPDLGRRPAGKCGLFGWNHIFPAHMEEIKDLGAPKKTETHKLRKWK